MKRLLLVVAVSVVFLTACSSDDDGGTSGGSSVLGDCFWIAGDSVVETTSATGGKENMNITIESNCDFVAKSPSTGVSYGTLVPTADGNYTGVGTTQACPSGKFQVSIIDGYLYADCI